MGRVTVGMANGLSWEMICFNADEKSINQKGVSVVPAEARKRENYSGNIVLLFVEY